MTVMKKIYLFTILSFFVLVPCFSACQTDIPINEMAEAHRAVRIAKALKADKYAPELFQKAEDNLYDSHAACKDDKIEDAKKFAAAAKSNAEEASKISWPFLAADTLKDAQNMYAEAETLNAVKAAPTQMNSAAEKIKKAESLNAESDYNLSYIESLSAIRDIEEAKSLSLAQSEVIFSKIADLRKEADGIKNDADAVPLLTDLASAEDLLNSAENDLNNKNIKTASEQTNEAEEKITALKAALIKAKNDSIALNQNATPDQKDTEPVKDDKPAEKPNDKPIDKPSDKTAQTGKKPEIYTVKYFPKEKDCLWRIAQKVYQDPTLWPRIYIANRDKIKEPDLIFPGQRLIIPDISDAVKAAKAKRAARITQRNTKPKNATLTKNTGTKGASKASGSKPVAPNRADKNKPENISKNKELTDKGKTPDKGGTSSGENMPPGNGTAGRDTFLPEGIFRENQ